VNVATKYAATVDLRTVPAGDRQAYRRLAAAIAAVQDAAAAAEAAAAVVVACESKQLPGL
jgi:hypothetical protein